ncbi:hypothetical protein L202_08418 [Cryptococcus amylolentus CBS 6039]|uniref:D-3-phosphoglycerate dehydrogenase n=2 Tax=Cryptococcus amylolentus TaxID=104669 RepID=A0A1E3H9M9_9TREE|nr:hypothetical protein L202_08418 [Cryptococcus amylolentus CBS 6039]ODN73023.1 hypothetical protein L202_08418 [Cryptococcus amylolentus CBS 6039]ODN98176.1 hypothetical protein I350_07822 [Cryptococcus amylolentus CBS 6273]
MIPQDLARLQISTHPSNPTPPPAYSPYLPTPPPEPSSALLPAAQATVFIPTPIHPQALAYARTRFASVLASHEVDAEEGWARADGVVSRAAKIGRAQLEAGKGKNKVAGIGIVGVGYDSIDIECCKERGITVMNCPGANSQVVAELTLSLTLALLRRVPELDRRLRQGEMMLSIDNLGRTLRGKKVGMVGMGATARRAADIFHHAFDCEIHIFSPTSPYTRWSTSDPSGPLPHTRHSSLASLLPLVDVLTLHCPLTDATRNMISTQELRWMKPGSVMVNMSRGAVVDEVALKEELSKPELVLEGEEEDGNGRKLWAAASDVFASEPIQKDQSNGLLDLPNFIGTPHIGGSTVEAQVDVCIQAIDQLADFFDGHQVRNRVC